MRNQDPVGAYSKQILRRSSVARTEYDDAMRTLEHVPDAGLQPRTATVEILRVVIVMQVQDVHAAERAGCGRQDQLARRAAPASDVDVMEACRCCDPVARHNTDGTEKAGW